MAQAYCVIMIAWPVSFEPVPAMIGILRSARRIANSSTLQCSLSVRVGASPVVAQTTMAEMPEAICQSISFPRAS